MKEMNLKVTPQVVPCNGTDLVRGEPINGKVPVWHMSYYNCPYCDSDKTPSDNVSFELPDGSTTSFLVTDDLLIWSREGWDAPRGVIFTELVRMVGDCSRGRHQYWKWQWSKP